MLKQRVITAAVLVVVLLAAMFAPSVWPLSVLLSIAAVCALWEWLRLSWPESASYAAPTVAIAVFCGMMALLANWHGDVLSPTMQTILAPLFMVATPLVVLCWVVGISLVLAFAQVQQVSNKVALSVFAVFAVIVAWASLVQMLIYRGPWYLLSMMAIVWVADIAAYFAGRAFGNKKLAPRISPGKTWAGFYGGAIAVVAYMLVTAQYDGTYAYALVQQWSSRTILVLIAIALTVLSVMGDLFESVLKRRAGVKDSSQLLPGHGGVYDRIDALLPVAPVALLLSGPVINGVV